MPRGTCYVSQAEIDHILSKYAGREERLLQLVQAKYGLPGGLPRPPQPAPTDANLECQDCTNSFVFTVGEQVSP